MLQVPQIIGDDELEKLGISAEKATEILAKYEPFFGFRQCALLKHRFGLCGYEKKGENELARDLRLPIVGVSAQLAYGVQHLRVVVQLESTTDARQLPFFILCDWVVAAKAGLKGKEIKNATQISRAMDKWCAKQIRHPLTIADVVELGEHGLLAIPGIGRIGLVVIRRLLELVNESLPA